MTQGYLSPIVAKGIFLEGLNLDPVRTRHGDYVEQDLADALMAADAPEHLVRGYEELAPGRRALIFCPTVAMTYAVEHAFRSAGLVAASVVGSTPADERQAIYQQVRAGALHALVSCAVLTEGFDEPSIDCIMLARPTKSKVLFYQCIGRGLRPWPTKDNCLLIDATGATKRHGLLSVAAELGLLLPKTPQEGPEDEEERRGKARPVSPSPPGTGRTTSTWRSAHACTGWRQPKATGSSAWPIAWYGCGPMVRGHTSWRCGNARNGVTRGSSTA